MKKHYEEPEIFWEKSGFDDVLTQSGGGYDLTSDDIEWDAGWLK